MGWDSARTMQTTIHTVVTTVLRATMAPGGIRAASIPTWMGGIMGGQSPPTLITMVSSGITGSVIPTLSEQLKWRFAPCSPTIFITGARLVLAPNCPNESRPYSPSFNQSAWRSQGSCKRATSEKKSLIRTSLKLSSWRTIKTCWLHHCVCLQSVHCNSVNQLEFILCF